MATIFRALFGAIGAIVGIWIALQLLQPQIDPARELSTRCKALADGYPVASERGQVFDSCLSAGKAALASRGVSVDRAPQKESSAPAARSPESSQSPVGESSRSQSKTALDEQRRRVMETPTRELGQVVLALMPPVGVEQVNWPSPESGLIWREPRPYLSEYKGETRKIQKALTRANVLGKVVSEAGNPNAEVPWELSFLALGPDGAKVQEISLEPDNACFGRGSGTGCEFAFEPSLEKAGIQYERICEVSWREAYYRLAAPDRHPVTLRHSRDAGSGGPTSWITLLVGESPKGKCGDSDGACCIK